MQLPKLPENQRWAISSELGTFIVVRLQERRKFLWWYYWETIARSSEYLSGGDNAVRSCVDHIINRDYYKKLRLEAERRRAESIARIPFGYHQGKD